MSEHDSFEEKKRLHHDKKNLVHNIIPQNLENTQIVPMVTLPEQYQEYLAGQKQMPEEDLQFIESLLEKYGLTNDPHNPERTQIMGADEFFSATKDVRDYIVYLRAKLDPKLPEEIDSLYNPSGMISESFFEFSEKARASNRRLQDICHLFLHIPKFRNIYIHIQEEKFAAGLPVLASDLENAPLQESPNLRVFLDRVTELMGNALSAGNHLSPTQTDDLAIIAHYAQFGSVPPKSQRQRFFASAGVDTFVNFVGDATLGSISAHTNVKEELVKAFQKGGLAHRLMRVSMRDTAKHLKDTEGVSLEANRVREKLDTQTFHAGSCPAMVTIEVTDGDKPRRRPIALEYALMIEKHIPDHLLKEV